MVGSKSQCPTVLRARARFYRGAHHSNVEALSPLGTYTPYRVSGVVTVGILYRTNLYQETDVILRSPLHILPEHRTRYETGFRRKKREQDGYKVW